jgi:hypothetical protein
VTVINTHMLVGWQKGNRRAALYQRQLNTVLRLHDEFRASGPVLVTGDFNKTKVPQMAAHNLTSSLTKGTHGSRTIDRVYSSGASPVSHTVLGKFGSDHSPVVATFVRQSAQAAGSVPSLPTKGSNGLTPRAQRAKNITVTRWGCANHPSPCISSIGGYANRNIGGTNVKSDHASGNAIDIMVSASRNRQLGDDIAGYFQTNAASLDVKYIIWNRKIWSPQRNSQGWRPYSGASAHTDHVHVSVNSGKAA